MSGETNDKNHLCDESASFETRWWWRRLLAKWRAKANSLAATFGTQHQPYHYPCPYPSPTSCRTDGSRCTWVGFCRHFSNHRRRRRGGTSNRDIIFPFERSNLRMSAESILSSQCHTFFFRAADACSAKYHVSHFRGHSNNDPLHGRAIAVKSTKV